MPHIEQKPERGIVAAACQINGATISMPAPARHHDVLWAMDAMGAEPSLAEQGFLDHRGVFLGRENAKMVALNWGQITQEEFDDGPFLYSEHIW